MPPKVQNADHGKKASKAKGKNSAKSTNKASARDDDSVQPGEIKAELKVVVTGQCPPPGHKGSAPSHPMR